MGCSLGSADLRLFGLGVVFGSTRKVGGGDGSSSAADGKAGKGEGKDEGKGERKGEEKEETVTEVESYVPLKDLVSTRCVLLFSVDPQDDMVRMLVVVTGGRLFCKRTGASSRSRRSCICQWQVFIRPASAPCCASVAD
jgi:hypothetical protein